jgi:hypothetical protein
MAFQDRGQSLGNKRLPCVERDPNSGFWFHGLLHFRFHGLLAAPGPLIYRTPDRGALAAAALKLPSNSADCSRMRWSKPLTVVFVLLARRAGHAQNAAESSPNLVPRLVVTVGKSLMLDSPVKIKRFAAANSDLIESVAIGSREVLINGKLPGEKPLPAFWWPPFICAPHL